MQDQDEIYDIVDSEDHVIGQATRREVHEKHLFHRSVHILVFDPAGHLFLQKRAPTKDENPGLWDTSAAGHVNSGEDYITSADRELEEELGISEPLERLNKFPACRETFWEHVVVYKCVTEKEIVINLQEITEGRYFSIEQLRLALDTKCHEFTSSFKLIFESCLLKGN